MGPGLAPFLARAGVLYLIYAVRCDSVSSCSWPAWPARARVRVLSLSAGARPGASPADRSAAEARQGTGAGRHRMTSGAGRPAEARYPASDGRLSSVPALALAHPSASSAPAIDQGTRNPRARRRDGRCWRCWQRWRCWRSSRGRPAAGGGRGWYGWCLAAGCAAQTPIRPPPRPGGGGRAGASSTGHAAHR